MRLSVALVYCSLALVQATSTGNVKRPQFSDYPVNYIFRGKSVPPVITKQFRSFRTMIRRGANSEVEFAGHYTIPRWGCGTNCNGFVIVDSVTGKIYGGRYVTGLPLRWLDHEGIDDMDRMEFQQDSSLLKINGCPNENNCGLYDFVMVEGRGLELVRRELLPNEFQ
jgi:hypothetical protein